mmetsp:Transcript_16083/g.28099  ORF Transcript_16083/g.28099 Transcript_16083/m.28099 type:complete len:452 (-) Transcript_16083:160-1515(-)
MEVYVQAIEAAVNSWKIVQTIPDYEGVVGETLFRKIFELAPGAISMYHFGEGAETANVIVAVPELVYSLPAFRVHAKKVVSMLETALVMMLGNNDNDNMNELALALQGLGAKHVDYGVLPQHYMVVETALLRTLQAGLKDHWTEELRKSWAAVFKFVSKAMMAGSQHELEIIKEERFEVNERKKWVTLRLKLIRKSDRTSKLKRRSSLDTRLTRSPRGVRESPLARMEPLAIASPLRLPLSSPPSERRGAFRKSYSGSVLDVSPKLPVRFLPEKKAGDTGTESQTLQRRHSDTSMQLSSRGWTCPSIPSSIAKKESSLMPPTLPVRTASPSSSPSNQKMTCCVLKTIMPELPYDNIDRDDTLLAPKLSSPFLSPLSSRTDTVDCKKKNVNNVSDNLEKCLPKLPVRSMSPPPPQPMQEDSLPFSSTICDVDLNNPCLVHRRNEMQTNRICH